MPSETERWFVLKKALIIAAVAGTTLMVAGCLEPKTKSYDGTTTVTIEQLQADHDRMVAKIKAEEKADQERAQAIIDKAKRDAARQVKSAQGEFSVKIDEIQAAIEDVSASEAAKFAENHAKRDEEVTKIDSWATAGQNDIARQVQAAQTTWGILKPFTALIPGVGGAVQSAGDQYLALYSTGVTGLAAYATLRARKAKNEADAAEEERARIKAEHEKAMAGASRAIDAIDVLKEKVPAVEEAFKSNKVLLDTWQGEAGKAFVDAIQKGLTTFIK